MRFFTAILALSFAGFLVPSAMAKEASTTNSPVYIIAIDDVITEAMVYTVRRGVREAMENQARTIILDLDTPGGSVGDTIEIMEMMENFKGETITYVNKAAYSGGAFLAASTKHIYMAPSSVIGGAAPVDQNGADLETTMKKKSESIISARVRASALRNGHLPEVFEAMVRDTSGLLMEGKVIGEKGDLLSLNDAEAAVKYGTPPKALLSEGTVDTMDDLLAKLNLSKAPVTRVEATGAEKIARFITMIAPLLMLIGIAGIYLEVKTPGISLPGIIAVIAFGIFYFGHYIAGLSGYEELTLFILGLILIGVEVFLLPGHILPGFLGIVAILVSLIWAMVDKIPQGPGFVLPSMPQLELPIAKVVCSIFGAAVLIAALVKWLPKAKGPYGGLILQTQMKSNEGYASAPTRTELIGQKGVSLSLLRPSGTARLGDKVVDVITEGDFIAADQDIVVKEVRGAQVIVGKL